MKHFIYHFTFIPHGLIRTHKWPAPNVSGFIARLVRASHRYREVTGSNPVEVLTFSGLYMQLLKLLSSVKIVAYLVLIIIIIIMIIIIITVIIIITFCLSLSGLS